MGKPKIVSDAPSYLVLPMPRLGMGTLRVDGHLLRVRRCPQCGLHTNIHECPLCGTMTKTPVPEEAPRPSRLRAAPASNAMLDTTIVDRLCRDPRCALYPCCSACPMCDCRRALKGLMP